MFEDFNKERVFKKREDEKDKKKKRKQKEGLFSKDDIEAIFGFKETEPKASETSIPLDKME